MPARLPALCDDDVDPCIDRSLCFFDAANLEQNRCASGVEMFHVAGRIAPKEAHCRHALFQANLQLLLVGDGRVRARIALTDCISPYFRSEARLGMGSA